LSKDPHCFPHSLKPVDDQQEEICVKYPELKMQKYEIENIINIDEKLISQVEGIEQIVESEGPTYPKYITVYEEKNTMYIQFNKSSKEGRYNLKRKILSNDIQKELDNLIIAVKEKYQNLELSEMKILNPNLSN
jgi:hypothetical protein